MGGLWIRSNAILVIFRFDFLADRLKPELQHIRPGSHDL